VLTISSKSDKDLMELPGGVLGIDKKKAIFSIGITRDIQLVSGDYLYSITRGHLGAVKALKLMSYVFIN
jgi:hypothetical protein